MKKMTKALFAGSFDPFTNGHLNTVERSALIFDKIVIAVAINPSKKRFFTVEEKINLIEEATEHLSNVEIISFSESLTVDVAKKIGAEVLIRGVRSVQDYEYETEIANMNKYIQPEIETFLLVAKPELSYVSSSLIKEVVRFGGEISEFVPANVEKAMKKKLKEVK